MCLYPKIVKNPKYKPNKKNKGNVPEAWDSRVMGVPIGCGMCFECLKQKANGWKIRLNEEIKKHKNGKFVTLTFSDKSYYELEKQIYTNIKGYELDNAIAKLAVKRFLERWRKKHGQSVRHWLITELGGTRTERIHLHGLIFTDQDDDINKLWQYGYTSIGKKVNDKRINYVNERTIGYITKYLTKTDPVHKYYKPVVLCSPGIGSSYTKTYNFKQTKFKPNETDDTYTNRAGFKMALPVYYRNKAYTEEEREKLWVEKMDKMERWVGGEKIDVSNGEEEYIKLRKYHRERNARMGYGSPRNWTAIKYEKERRILKQEENKRRRNVHAG